MAYDPYAEQDQQQQMEMQNQLRQRMQRFGGVNPMNFNPEAQGVRGFAPNNTYGGMQANMMNAQNQMGNTMQNYQKSMDESNAGITDMERNAYAQNMAGQQPMAPPPESMAPQLPQHMQMQRNRMMQQRAMANRNNMMQAPPTAAQARPSMEGYKQGGAPADFMGMRNAADAARGAMTPAKPMGGMGRVAAGLGAAGSAMGLANQARNQAKKQQMVSGRSKTAAKAKTAGGQLSQPPTF